MRGGDLKVPVMSPLSLSCEWASSSAIFICARGSLFEPLIPISMSIPINHRGWSERAETSNERALHVQISAVSRESNRVRRTRQEFGQR
jgi:hypothetical protein